MDCGGYAQLKRSFESMVSSAGGQSLNGRKRGENRYQSGCWCCHAAACHKPAVPAGRLPLCPLQCASSGQPEQLAPGLAIWHDSERAMSKDLHCAAGPAWLVVSCPDSRGRCRPCSAAHGSSGAEVVRLRRPPRSALCTLPAAGMNVTATSACCGACCAASGDAS